MKALFLGAASAIATFLALTVPAPDATAATFNQTYLGVIDSDLGVPVVDAADLFGGGDLTGDLITASFDYDPSLGTLTTGTGPDAGTQSLDGGFLDFTTSPITAASFTIYDAQGESFTYSYVPDARGSIQTAIGSDVNAIANSLGNDEANVALLTPDAPGNIYTSFTSITLPDGTGFNNFSPGVSNTATLDNITFDTYAVQVSSAPEPASWILMIIGVSFVGSMMRYWRRSAYVPNA